MLCSLTLQCVIQKRGQILTLGSALSQSRIPGTEKCHNQMLSSQFLVSFYVVQKKDNIRDRAFWNELCIFNILRAN